MLQEAARNLKVNSFKAYPYTQQEIVNINQVLSPFGVKVDDVKKAPRLVTYIVNLNVSTKIKALLKLEQNFCIAVNDNHCRIYLDGNKLCIEKKGFDNVVSFGNLTKNKFVGRTEGLRIALGYDNLGRIRTYDLAQAPHILVAGYTGSGKSVFLRSIIASILLNHDNDVDFIGIDPKGTEFTEFDRLPEFTFIRDTTTAIRKLNDLTKEMDNRYYTFGNSRVRDIDEYNRLFGKMKRIVCVIDEFADLMLTGGRQVETAVVRLAQKARAAGIHLVIGTQRPTVDVITGLIKANIPCRVALSVRSALDSRIILDQSGAEKLNGKGDMLFQCAECPEPIRIQGCYITNEEIEIITRYAMFSNHAEEGSILNGKEAQEFQNFVGYINNSNVSRTTKDFISQLYFANRNK